MMIVATMGQMLMMPPGTVPQPLSRYSDGPGPYTTYPTPPCTPYQHFAVPPELPHRHRKCKEIISHSCNILSAGLSPAHTRLCHPFNNMPPLQTFSGLTLYNFQQLLPLVNLTISIVFPLSIFTQPPYCLPARHFHPTTLAKFLMIYIHSDTGFCKVHHRKLTSLKTSAQPFGPWRSCAVPSLQLSAGDHAAL
ncbi:hypothetical protein PAXRUDRAFT_713764 [Paxillus rubicundulus Ve08.2h10]|uniref:Uncharacterized protein n=1 Tax=Paxillus rubicundulus Ve08.2h10 TaxID=930991 RepID=A0A0D0EAS7_9AGAM|nr:hypothetical protein PAXRUDRAFT_713764 [Paxillus rubicundulus Ve08.2h10]